jgi:hypothetical protein
MINKPIFLMFLTFFVLPALAQEPDTTRIGKYNQPANISDTVKSQIETRKPQVVFEGELEIGMMDETKLDYTFYKGDEISLIAKPVKGKDISGFVFKRRGEHIISQYKSKPNLELRFSIPETDTYSFIFQNTALLSSKIISVRISRFAVNDSTQALDVLFRMKVLPETTYIEVVKDTAYLEVINKTIRLGRGILASDVQRASMDIPLESDGNVAIIIGSEKEVSEWLGKFAPLAAVDPASQIIAGILIQAVQSTGGNEINWHITDANNARLAANGSQFYPIYSSYAVSFETKAQKLEPGKTYYLVLTNPSIASAKDIKVQAKARIIHKEMQPLIPKK